MGLMAMVQGEDPTAAAQAVEGGRAGVAAIAEFLDIHLFYVAGTSVTLATIILLALILAGTAWFSHLTQRALRRLMGRRGITDEGTIELTNRLIHYLVMGVGLAIALHTIGINLAALFAAGAIFAIALGFAMQNIAENFVSGLILLAERAIKPGDVLQLEDRVVRITRLGIRSTVGRTRDEEELIIPNSMLAGSIVTNFTMRDSLYRIRSKVSVVYGSDMRQVIQVLRTAAESVAWRDTTNDPNVIMMEFGDSSVNFEVRVWVTDPWRAPQYHSELNQAVWFALQDAGITIAFPQLDVHFDPPVQRALQTIQPAG